MTKDVAIIGSGPAALMAASTLATHGHHVHLFEKNSGAARKLLIAGASGLNISNTLPLEIFFTKYEGSGIDWLRLLQQFSPGDWLDFVARLGLETFVGTSGRYFVREMKAAGLVRAWLADLESKAVELHYSAELIDFDLADESQIALHFADGKSTPCSAVILALGGASSLATNDRLQWPQLLAKKGVQINSFAPANCGFEVRWKKEFLSEATRQPLKNVSFTSSAGSAKGDILITEYGVEGTPIYTYGRAEVCRIDLKSDLSAEQILKKIEAVRENLSPLRRATKALHLTPIMQALIYHHAPPGGCSTNQNLARLLKNFPIELLQRRPLSEAISSSGGVSLAEVTPHFELKKFPGIFAVGEMLDWSAPTGGFLIQACVSQGFVAAKTICDRYK
ncbi:MAG: TIGR03862 family flavoprotein [Spirochaetes bacterium]|nr:TIGR03862 family flavoprotein [Spirochaetota bacterium]